MDRQNKEIIKNLAAMAWADGEVSKEERTLLFATCDQLGASQAELDELKELLGQPLQTEDSESLLEFVPEKAGRLNVMRALLTMSFIDGVLAFAEYDLIEKKAQELQISPEELEALRVEALEASKSFNNQQA